jgi:hypothetical protein
MNEFAIPIILHSTGYSTHSLTSQFPVQIRLKFFRSKNVYSTYSPSPSMYAWSLCNHSWNVAIKVSSGMSARVRTTPSRSSSAVWNSVPWSSLFTWPKRKSRSVLSLGSRADMVHPSGCYPRDIAWFFWRRVAWHCRRVPLISNDLLHHEERIFREECDQYNIGWSTSVLSAEEMVSGIHVDSTPLSALFSDCWSFVVELLACLPDLGARFVRVDSRNKPGFVQGYKIFPALVLDWTQQIQETFWCSGSGLFLCLW